MCGAAVHAKHPTLPVLASSTVGAKPSKLSRKTAEAKMKPPPPQDALADESFHPSGIMVEIVRMEWGNQGRSC